MIGYLLPLEVLNETIMGNSDDLKTNVSSGWRPVTITDGSSGRGNGGSILIISFFGSAKKCFTLSVLREIDSRDAFVSIFERTVISSACRRSSFLVCAPSGSFMSSIMKSYSTFAKSLRYSTPWSSLLSSHSTMRYQWK